MKNNVEPNFFFVNRDLLHSSRWLSEPFTRGQAWVDLFGLAQHTKGFFRIRGIKIDVDRGQLAYSQLTLAKRWQWSRGKVNRYLSELENQKDITLKMIQQNGQQIKFLTTLITIEKYDKWQSNDTVKRTPNEHQTNTKQNIYNNNNNDNNTIVAPKVATEPFSYKTYVETMKADKSRHIQIIALYWEWRRLDFSSKELAQKAISRDLRPAQALVGYTNKEIEETMDYIDGLKFINKPTLETVNKYIAEVKAGNL